MKEEWEMRSIKERKGRERLKKSGRRRELSRRRGDWGERRVGDEEYQKKEGESEVKEERKKGESEL